MLLDCADCVAVDEPLALAKFSRLLSITSVALKLCSESPAKFPENTLCLSVKLSNLSNNMMPLFKVEPHGGIQTIPQVILSHPEF